MVKVAVIILADTETHSDMGRVTNALELAKECVAAKDEIQLIFDGAGTKWIPELSKPENHHHELFTLLKGKLNRSGFSSIAACKYCAGAFEVATSIQKAEIELRGEFDEHPSLRKLIAEGYETVTF